MAMSTSTEFNTRTRKALTLIFACISTAAFASCKHAASREAANCSPDVAGIAIADLKVNEGRVDILHQAFKEDQEDRQLPSQRALTDSEWDAIDNRDDARLDMVVGALRASRNLTARDLYYSSVILLHGTCPDHYRLARDLSERAIELGERDARSIYANATDRHLVSEKKLQRFGTQYECGESGCALLPYDPATTDAERAQYDVPKLVDALKGP